MNKKRNITSDTRRDLLAKTMIVAGGIIWSKPVVTSIVLPAHALTTEQTGSSPTGDSPSDNGNPGSGGDNPGGDTPGDEPTSNGNSCDCESPVYYYIKANWNGDTGRYEWEADPGNNHCLKDTPYPVVKADGSRFGSLNGDAELAVFSLNSQQSRIVEAQHKAANNCIVADFSSECGGSATFTKVRHGISHVSLVVLVCEP